MSDKNIFCWAKNRLKRGDKVKVVYNSSTAYDGMHGKIDQVAGEEALIIFDDKKGSDWIKISDLEKEIVDK